MGREQARGQLAWGGRRLAATTALVAATLLIPGAARAAEPFDLPGELTDRAGVLDAATEATLAQRQSAWTERTDLQLFVVAVDDFGGLDPATWTQRTAELSGLGEQDLAVAVSTDGDAALLVPEGARLPAAEVAAVSAAVEQAAAEEDIAGAVEAAVDGLGALDPIDPQARARSTVLWVTGSLLALLTLAAAVLWWHRRRRAAAQIERARVRADHLSTALGAQVIALDRELAETRLVLDLAAAELDRAQTAEARSELAAAELETLDVHRRRADLSIGPTDDLTWRRPAPEAVIELESLAALVATARGRLARARAAVSP